MGIDTAEFTTTALPGTPTELLVFCSVLRTITTPSHEMCIQMILSAGKTFSVEYGTAPGTGSPWVVRVYRKRFLVRQRISSDWFLEADQAKRFAEGIAAQLRNGASTDAIRNRKPGWTLMRPPH
jgi:hypothetical protein